VIFLRCPSRDVVPRFAVEFNCCKVCVLKFQEMKLQLWSAQSTASHPLYCFILTLPDSPSPTAAVAPLLAPEPATERGRSHKQGSPVCTPPSQHIRTFGAPLPNAFAQNCSANGIPVIPYPSSLAMRETSAVPSWWNSRNSPSRCESGPGMWDRLPERKRGSCRATVWGLFLTMIFSGPGLSPRIFSDQLRLSA